MCAISTALKTLFLENGDSNESIKIAVPAGTRFYFYPTRQDVKAENKFTAIPLLVPLCNSMKDSYKVISKVTKILK